MKAYLITTGVIWMLFGVSHSLITLEHWRSQDQNDLHGVLAPLVIAVLGTALAVWAFRLTARVSQGT